jgi:hypothetical protein
MNIILATILGIVVVYLLFYPLLVMSKQDKPSDKVFRIYHENKCDGDCKNCPMKDLCGGALYDLASGKILTRVDYAEIWLTQNDYICRKPFPKTEFSIPKEEV